VGSRLKIFVRGLAVAACTGLVLPGVALAVTGTYNGMTPQGNTCRQNLTSPCAVRIRVVRNFVKASPSDILWHARCRSGGALTGDSRPHGRLKKGRLDVRTVLSSHGTTPDGSAISVRETVTILLAINGRQATGTLVARDTLFSGSTVIDYCATGRIAFVARR